MTVGIRPPVLAAFMLAALLALNPAARAGPATAPATQAADPQVSRLITQLGADDWRQREQASAELLKLGMAVLPHIADALERTTDPEMRTRLEALARRIPEADLTLPTYITLKATNAPARVVLAEIASQAGVPIAFWPENDNAPLKPVTVDFQRRPFWRALLEVCAQADLSPEDIGQRGAIRLMRTSAMRISPFAHDVDQFLFTVDRLNRNYSVSFVSGPEARVNTSFQVTMTVWIDPKALVLRHRYAPLITEARDERGNSLAPPATPSSSYYNSFGGRNWRLNLNVPLHYPEGAGKKIASLRGTWSVVLATRVETVEFTEIIGAKDVSRAVGPFQVTLKEFARSGAQSYRWSLTMTGLGGVPVVSSPANPLAPTALYSIVGANGEPITEGTITGGISGSIGSANVPTKLIIRVATELREEAVPFVFKDIPIP